MNSKFFYASFFLFLAFLSGFSQTKKIFTLILDAGHGGKDTGAYGYGGNEKDIALAVAKKLGKYIDLSHKDKVNVIYTRYSDEFVSLKERADIANKNQGDLFVSIHCNSSYKNSPKGSETYVLALRRNQDNLEVIKRENSVISFENQEDQSVYEGFDPDSPESFIGFTLIQSIYLKKSIEFASLVEKNFNLYGRNSRGVKQGPFLVVREVSMPSVLVELGFLSSKEGLFLGSERGQSILAWSIYKAFIEFFNRYVKERSSFIDFKSNEKFSDSKISNPKSEKWIPENKELISYHIQLFSLLKKISTEDQVFKGLNPINCFKEGNFYKYIFHPTSKIEEIKAAFELVKKKGFSSAFITKNGKKLSFEELNILLKK